MSLQDQFQSYLEGKIDFEGQKLADQITRYVLISSTIISFFAGLIAQSLKVTFSVLSFLFIVLILVVLPPWPMFNRHPIAWLPKRPNQESKKSQ